MDQNQLKTNIFSPNHSHQIKPEPAAVGSFGSFEPPKPVERPSDTSTADSLRPMPVVKVLSPVGVEYVFLTITLLGGAIALAASLIALVNGKTDFSVLAFPVSSLLVTVPVFAVIFLHLKKMEVANPDLKLDPSKRRSTQFTQIVAFIACLSALVGFVFDIFSKIGGQIGPSILKAGLDVLCVLVVAGGILFYYWREEHKRWY